MKITWRIKPLYWFENQQFEEIVRAIRQFENCFDEVSLFIGDMLSWHGYTPEGDLKKQIALAGERLRELRANSVPAVGFNVWPTFGNEGTPLPYAPKMPKMPFPGRVLWNGDIMKKTACPNSPGFKAYVRAMYTLAASEAPDFIWIDDDLSSSRRYPCFCKLCLSKFQNGKWSDREKLVTALNDPDNTELRVLWNAFFTETLREFCVTIRDATDKVNPDIDLGLMTIGVSVGTYAGDYIRKCMDALRSIRGRPGHGYYSDKNLREITGKIMEVAWQNAIYPSHVTDKQFEYEDWPCFTLDKADKTILNEITLALAAGCSGIAMNTFHFTGYGIKERYSLMQRFEQVRPGWDFFNDFVQGMELYGLYPVFTKYRKARHTVTKDRKWLDENNNGNRCNTVEVKEWAEIGFPITGNEHSSCGALLVADAAEGLTDDEIRTLLSGPVFMDIDALKILHERGFSSLAGAEPGRYIHGTHERFTDHPVNGSHKGYMRTMFWYGGNEVIPTAPETQIVSELIEFDAKTKSADCMTMYENQLGGRVVVMGYEPWSHLGLSWKWQQLQSVVDWATRGMLPLSIDRMVRVLPLVRMNESRTKFGLLLFNNGLDDTGKFRIRLKNKAKKVMALSPHGKRNPVPATWEYGVLTIEIDSIGAWDTLMLIGG